MKQILLSLCCLYAAAAVTLTGNSIVSWGLSNFGKERTPTVSAVGAALLQKYQGLYVGDTSQREVYLTFDLGYEAGYTTAVLDILQEYQIKGIFFLCGNYLKETSLINRMQQEGHQIGNHTNHHKDLPTLSETALREDLQSLKLPGPTQWFRPPARSF